MKISNMLDFTQYLSTRVEQNNVDKTWLKEFESFVQERTDTYYSKDTYFPSTVKIKDFFVKHYETLLNTYANSSVESAQAKEFHKRVEFVITTNQKELFKELFRPNVYAPGLE